MIADRRKLLKLAGAGALAAAFPESIKRALAVPAHHRTGTLQDVEHVVFLMQENRSFDHYFGTLRGVRGFGDKHPMRLASGESVFSQPDGAARVIPFHYALADAFTVCDAYHCSFLGATDPNRYHMWTGWTGNDGKNGGPVLGNDEAGYDWRTYPERLEAQGISWKIYQDIGLGLDAANFWGWGPPFIGNYGDNSLLYFHQYQNAAEGSPL